MSNPPPIPDAQREAEEALGLSIDMLDVDRLREWARLLLVHGADISHWGSVPHVASKLQTLATDTEKAVRDIGTLREQLTADCERLQQENAAEKEAHRLRTAALQDSIDGCARKVKELSEKVRLGNHRAELTEDNLVKALEREAASQQEVTRLTEESKSWEALAVKRWDDLDTLSAALRSLRDEMQEDDSQTLSEAVDHIWQWVNRLNALSPDSGSPAPGDAG